MRQTGWPLRAGRHVPTTDRQSQRQPIRIMPQNPIRLYEAGGVWFFLAGSKSGSNYEPAVVLGQERRADVNTAPLKSTTFRMPSYQAPLGMCFTIVSASSHTSTVTSQP
jgi:hypothetical protein